jgi:hypothetical protein
MLTKHTLCYKIKKKKAKSKTKQNDRQNISVCIRNLDTNKEREKANEQKEYYI